VNADEYAGLCRRAAACLGLDDEDGFDGGAVVEVRGVETQLIRHEMAGSAYLMFDVGSPMPDVAAEVHRELLELHCLFVGRFDGVFMRDPVNDGLVFSVRTPLHSRLTGDQLAQWVTMMAEQVIQWRSTVLAGKMIDKVPAEPLAKASAAFAQRA